MRWLYLRALMESWLVAANLEWRHTESWSYIQGSTCDCENEGKTDNLGWMQYSVIAVLGECYTRCMLYSVYAVLCVNSWSWDGEIERDDLTLCSAMMVKKERWQWRWERYGGYERISVVMGWTCLLGFRRLCSSVSTRPMGSSACCIRKGKLTRTRNSLKSQFLMMISPISSHLSLSLPSPKNTKLSHPYLSLHAMIMS